MHDASQSAPDIERAAPDLVIVPVGSIEQHAAHLPVDTDLYIAERAGRAVAEQLGCLVLPALPYSVNLEHRGFAGVVGLRPDTLRRVVWDIAESVGRWGLRHVAFVSFHGGNFMLNPAAREWNLDGHRPRIIVSDFYAALTGVGANLHACEVETSIMLHIAPDRVRLERARDFVPEYAREDLTTLGMKAISPSGVWGHPSRATAEKGARWLAEGVEKCAQRIARLRDATAEG